MVDEKEIKKWRKYRRQSVQSLPYAVAILLFLCVALFVANLIVRVPAWLATILIGVSAFSVIGDTINILHLGRKLRAAETRDGSAPAG